MLALLFPQIDPVIVQIGPFGIRWYALAYIAGILFGWRWCLVLMKRPPQVMDARTLDDFLLWLTLGIVLGGRLGYVLFYKPLYFLEHPWDIPAIWQGGMSFHGGMLGVVLALVLFARRRKLSLLSLADLIACCVPIGLCFGRLANFINGELWGRMTDLPWGMIFPTGGPYPRHPSQIYEALLEGVVLFTVLNILERRGARRRPGLLSGIFLIGYGAARVTAEIFREPDAFLGFLVGGLTMGQLLSLPMILLGVALVLRSRARPAIA